MSFKTVIHCGIAIGVAFWTAACATGPASVYSGPGCLIYINSLPNLQGNTLPVVRDTQDLAAAWHDTAASAKVIYGTWRLFTNADFKGFMGDYKAPADIPQLTPAHQLGSLKCITPEPGPPAPRY
jgi:hypothetical protein